MEFRILGPLEVVEGDRQIQLGGRKPRALLAMLILRRRQIVAVDDLIEAVWGDEAPKTADHSVQVYVSELRKALDTPDTSTIVVRRDPGYALELRKPPLTCTVSKISAQRGRAALDEEDSARASALLAEALGVWRGTALADFTYDDFARGEIERLEELRLATIEDRLDADLALGRHGDLVAELRALVDEHPARERLRADLMLALYRSGRQAEGVEVFHTRDAHCSARSTASTRARSWWSLRARSSRQTPRSTSSRARDWWRSRSRSTRIRRTHAQDREHRGGGSLAQPRGRFDTGPRSDRRHRSEDR